jgi:hypothetical protein
MPHSNGTIYIDTTTTPHQGIDVQGDIAKVLGSSSGDLGTLCMHGSINKWAKYKPVRNTMVNTADQYDFTNQCWKSSATWWQSCELLLAEMGKYNCGLDIKNFSTVAELITAHDNAKSQSDINTYLGWTYLCPRGKGGGPSGRDEWFRAFDFVQYKHDSQAPFTGIDYPGNTPWSTQQSTQTATVALNLRTSGSLELSLADIPGIANLYFGAFVYQGTSLYGMGTASDKIGVGGPTATRVSIPVPQNPSSDELYERTYNVYPFFSRVPQATFATQDQRSDNTTNVPPPFYMATFKCTNKGLNPIIKASCTIYYRIDAQGNYSFDRVDYYVDFYGRTNIATTYTNPSLQLGIVTDSSFTALFTMQLSTVTVPAGTEETSVTGSLRPGYDIERQDINELMTHNSFIYVSASGYSDREEIKRYQIAG